MLSNFIKMPMRQSKPRATGLTVMIDNGYSLKFYEDVVASHHSLIDFIKFGWGTALITPMIREKIAIARAHDIDVFMGGTLFEKSAVQNKVPEYASYLNQLGVTWLEVSNGTIDIDNTKKAEYIRQLAGDFNVFSEVGFKDSERSLELYPAQWVEYIQQDFAAGSKWVITEARESGTSGICRADGEIRFGLINEIANSGIDIDKMIFEAPNKNLQKYFIEHFGANVNLANIAFNDVIPLETLRLGLRSDTLMMFEERNQ
jgi:phosphosulfolactate synthase